MGNVWVDVFILNSTYGYISADRFTGTIHPTPGHGDKAGCASCFPGRGPQTTWHQVSPQGVWVSSSIFSTGDRAKANGDWMQIFGVLRGGRARMLPALRHSVRANPDCLSSVEEPWKLLALLPTWDFLCLGSQRELSLKHRHADTGRCPGAVPLADVGSGFYWLSWGHSQVFHWLIFPSSVSPWETAI